MSLLLVREKALRENSEILSAESLTYAYVQDGKADLAESTFSQGLAIRRKRNPDYLPSTAEVDNLMWALLYQLKFDKAEAVMNELLSHGNSKSGEYLDLLGLDVDVLARSGRWAKAQAAGERLRDARPDDFGCYHKLAPLMVANNDLAGYRRLCQQILSRFPTESFPVAADQMAKDCLILPSAGVDLQPVAAMAEVAVTRGQLEPAYPFFQCCKALAEYRQGHFDGAVKWAQFASMNPFPYSQAEAFAVLSMAQFKLNHAEEARVTLAKCEKVVRGQLPPLGMRELSRDWRDWIIAHALFTEATHLIRAEH
jgi:tetratricopeptide (TPR) repeat protein